MTGRAGMRGLRLKLEIRWVRGLAACVALAAAVAACGPKKQTPALGQADADKFLFDRGTENLTKKNWLVAREYFRRLVDTYPQSPYRTDAKLGIGDTYIGENEIESLILGANEFREFLQFFPLNPRADYAQYRLCVSLSKQMLKPQLDQAATRETLVEIQRFIDNYPDSKYRKEIDALYRTARDRLSDHEFGIGMTYFKGKYYRGALPRWLQLLKDDPGYSHRDQVYYFVGEALRRSIQPKEAIPYYERLMAEFPRSKYVPSARKYLDLLKKSAP
jgi:outer membrane protein assembly factor BamD